MDNLKISSIVSDEFSRKETGPLEVQVNGQRDWPGMFIRGEDCFGIIMALGQVLEYLEADSECPDLNKMYLSKTIETLSSVLQSNDSY
jgi:hypothetical protein